MTKTKIEWCDYTINPIKGLCKYACTYCYARAMYKRFKWDEKIRFIPEELDKIATIKKPSKIFICSTHDIMGDWLSDEWRDIIINTTKHYPQHTFLFLTKNPRRYYDFDFPKNCWLGATITGNNDIYKLEQFRNIKCDNKKFLSIEPLLENIAINKNFNLSGINWCIIGGLT